MSDDGSSAQSKKDKKEKKEREKKEKKEKKEKEKKEKKEGSRSRKGSAIIADAAALASRAFKRTSSKRNMTAAAEDPVPVVAVSPPTPASTPPLPDPPKEEARPKLARGSFISRSARKLKEQLGGGSSERTPPEGTDSPPPALSSEPPFVCSPPSSDHYDHLIKVVLVGDSGVGKTNLLSRVARNEFKENYTATIGVEFANYTYTTTDPIPDARRTIKAQIWDTAGQERFRAITTAYYRGAKAAVIVYDVNEPKTYEHVNNWITEVQTNAASSDETNGPLIMVIGNKIDSPKSDHRVDTSVVRYFCKERNYLFFEASAKSGENVRTAFNSFIEAVYDQRLNTKKGSSLTDSRKRTPPNILANSKPVAVPADEASSSSSSSSSHLAPNGGVIKLQTTPTVDGGATTPAPAGSRCSC